MDRQTKAMLKARYREALVAVDALLVIHDPVGLIELGAPINEYSFEAVRLVRFVLRQRPPSGAEVAEVWQWAFGEPYGLGDP